MATFSGSANFNTTGGAAGYTLDMTVTTSQVSGGTKADISVSATRIRFDLTPAYSSNGSKSYNTPGGRVSSPTGNLAESGSATWSYDFRSSSTQYVWAFTRYYPTSYGSSASITVTAAGSGSSFLLSTPVTVNIDLFQNVTVPNIVGLSRTSANTTLTNAGLGYSGSVTTNTLGSQYNDIVSFQSPSSGTSVASGSTVYYDYYGTYVAPTWTVTFNRDGGGSTTTTTATDGTSVTLPSTPVKTGYTFTGWRSSYNNNVYGANTSSHAIYADTTFTAQWTAIQYTISFEENGGTNVSNITANVNSTVTLPTTSTKSGYTFNGWYSNSSLTVGPYTTWTITGTQTLYAKWTAIAPGFDDESITQSLILNEDISTTANNSVSATNATSYAIAYAGSNLNPTSWLSIDNSGNLSGSTNQVGIYSFIINATGAGGTTPSNIKTITVLYPGSRFNASVTEANISTAKRRDQFGNWVNITSMKRFDGTNWIDITN